MDSRTYPEAENRTEHLSFGNASNRAALDYHPGSIVPGVVVELVTGSQGMPILEEALSKNNVFVFQVRGHGMGQDHIIDGDYLIVERWAVPNEGDLVVACLSDGTIALGRFLSSDRGIRLASANPSHRAPEVDPQALPVQGIVVGILRKYGSAK
jgi:repressor LexA